MASSLLTAVLLSIALLSHSPTHPSCQTSAGGQKHCSNRGRRSGSSGISVVSAWRLAELKPCPEGCLANGNCNHELGVCECNFGWAGPSCSEAHLGACRSSDSPRALVMYGTAWPKSCECWRQLFRQSLEVPHIKTPSSEWTGYGQPGFEVVMGIKDIHPMMVSRVAKYCYERKDTPPERQFSDVPLPGDPDVTYLSPGHNFKPVDPPEQIRSFASNQLMLPLWMCPDRCSDRGACMAPDDATAAAAIQAAAAAAGGPGKGAGGRLLTRAAAAARGAQEAARGNSRAPSKRVPHQTIADHLHHHNGHDREDAAGLRHVRLGRRQLSLGSFLASLLGFPSKSNPEASSVRSAYVSPLGSSTPSHTSAGAYKGFFSSGADQNADNTDNGTEGGAAAPPLVPGLFCSCRKGFVGASCGQADKRHNHFHGNAAGDKACLNRCSGVGRCLAGFCKCPPMHWGMDCSRTQVWEPDPGSEAEREGRAWNRTHLRIYRYELPWQVTFPYELDDGWPSYDHMYSAFERFFESFSGDWAVRTENPGEANLFYVPFLPMYRYFRERPHQQVWQVMQYVKEQYPQLWGRHQGRDHFLWMAGDLGACHLLDDSLVQAPIKLVHFGLQVPLSLHAGMPGEQFVRSAQPLRAPERYGCHLASKDVVTVCNDVGLGSDEYLNETHWLQDLDPAAPPRPTLLFFGGSLRLEQPSYSGGARQAYHQHVLLRNHPRVQYGGDLRAYRNSTFCFCPYGDGWGNRLPHAVLGGCIPVIVQEHVHQPFHDLLPYSEFSLVLGLRDMPQLLSILEAVPHEQVLRYRAALYRHRKAFYWYEDGQAYDMTLRSLWRRRHQMAGSP